MTIYRYLLVPLWAACFTAVTAEAQWTLQSPDTLRRTYNNVFMLDGHTGWITGYYGSIVKTTNGGSTWALQFSNPFWYNGVGQIVFTDSLTGFALGSNSWGQLLLRTTDGGTIWSVDSVTFKVLTDSGYFPMNLRVTKSGSSSRVSILFSAVLGPGKTNLEVYSSTDRGMKWSLCSLPPIPNQDIREVIFPSVSTELVIAPDSIYRSSDAGETWTVGSVTVSPYFYPVTWKFLNPDTGYFAGPTNSSSFTTPLTVGWTYDGGRTWSVDTNQALTGVIMGTVLFLTPEHGVAVKWNKGSIFQTTDGGTTWMENVLANPIPPIDISSADGRTIVAAGAGGEIIVSNDCGKSWTDLTPPKEIVFTQVKYLTDHLVAAVGDADGLFISTDSAETWTRHQMPSGLKVVAAFADSLNCWIGDDSSRIFHSSDLGITWTFQNKRNVPAPPLYGINFLNDSIGCAVGGGGYITSTTDGGANWESTTVSAVDSLYGIFIASPTKAWAVGGLGTILCTSDGFKNWALQTSPTRNALRTVFFSDALNGYVFGDGGIILKTTDGGNTWILISSPSSGLNAMKFVSSSTGWVVGDSGKIFKTVNGGEEWSPQKSGIGVSLLSLDFADRMNGVIIGAGGIVLTTKNGGEETGVEERLAPVPVAFLLEQNFPNPFNPSTIISYRLPMNSLVTLKVYDVLGREVRTLVNGIRQPGTYEVEFNGSGLPSGVYFYKIEIHSINQTGLKYEAARKLMLIK